MEDVRRAPKRLVAFSPDVAAENAALKRYPDVPRLFRLGRLPKIASRSVAQLDALFSFFLEHPERMPKFYADLARSEPPHRIVCDYIAGMTDHFLLRQCHELFGSPEPPETS